MNEPLALIVVMLATGYLSARRGWLPEHAAEVLHRFVITVCLPALVLSIVPTLTLERALLWAAVVPWLLLGAGAALVALAGRVLSLSREVRATLLLCAPLGNTSFLGYPMLEALIGPDAVRVGVLYDQLGSFLMLTTYGLLVVAHYSGGDRPGPGAIALRVVRFPAFVALCAGAVFNLVPGLWPPLAAGIAARVGGCLVPIAMFAVGLQLQLRPPRPWPAFAAGLLIKMIALPALALAIVGGLGLDGPTGGAIILESAMPPMITAGALAIMARLAPELAAALVGYGIVISLATLPVWAAL